MKHNFGRWLNAAANRHTLAARIRHARELLGRKLSEPDSVDEAWIEDLLAARGRVPVGAWRSVAEDAGLDVDQIMCEVHPL